MKLSQLVEGHLQHYNTYERQKFDKARRYYRGDFYNTVGASERDAEYARMLTAHNLIFAVAETAIVNMVGNNPEVGFVPRSRDGHERADVASSFARYSFERNKIRSVASLSLLDAVLCNRGIFKTGYSFERDEPVTRAADPASVFYDPTVRHVDDIPYWLEATVVKKAEFERRIKSGMYPKVRTGPTAYPRWMVDSGKRENMSSIDQHMFYEVWEYYDLERGKLVHYLRKPSVVLYEEDLIYNPYDLFFMNHSGVDCYGISEVELILGHQEKINDMLTLAITIAYKTIGRIIYDSGSINIDDVKTLALSNPGDYVGVHVKNGLMRMQGMRMQSLFAQSPQPAEPRLALETVDKLMDMAGHTSALAQASRGAIVNARTATEVASIEAQQTTRIGYRQANLYEALAGVAKKHLFLSQRHMSRPKFIKVGGSDQPFTEVDLSTIRGIEGDFEVSAYNALRSNPVVLVETMQAMLAPLMEAQAAGVALGIDLDVLWEDMLRKMNFTPRAFRSAAEKKKMQDAMAAATAPPPAEAPPEMPPEAMPPEAGGGGAPMELTPEMQAELEAVATGQMEKTL